MSFIWHTAILDSRSHTQQRGFPWRWKVWKSSTVYVWQLNDCRSFASAEGSARYWFLSWQRSTMLALFALCPSPQGRRVPSRDLSVYALPIVPFVGFRASLTGRTSCSCSRFSSGFCPLHPLIRLLVFFLVVLLRPPFDPNSMGVPSHFQVF